MLERSVDELGQKIKEPENKKYFDEEVGPVFDQLIMTMLKSGGYL